MEIVIFIGLLIVILFFLWIREQFDRFKKFRRCKKAYPIYSNYLAQVKALLKIKNPRISNTKLEKLKKYATQSELVDVLELVDFDLILSLPENYFHEWSIAAKRVIELNSEYPYAIKSLIVNKICFQVTGFNDCAEYKFLSEDDINSYSKESLESILKLPNTKLDLSNRHNEFVYKANYAFNLSVYQSEMFQRDIARYHPEVKEKFGLNPFNDITFSPSTDYANISYRLHGVKKLYHFTDRSNIDSIIRNGGLYSWAALNELNIPSKMGGDDLSHNLDKRGGLEDYVRLSSNCYLPMQYRLEELDYDLVLLEIHPIVLLMNDVLFSNKNATASDVLLGNTWKHCSALTVGAHCGILSRDDKRFEAAQAEVLVKHFLPLKYIINIYDIKY